MEYANNLRHEVSLISSRVVDAIEANLKRIGITHNDHDEESLEFFSYKNTAELDICGINADGTLIGTEGTIRGAIEDDQVSLLDAISLLEDLEAI